jgi:protoporphyrinogen IX oxidase
VTSPVVRAAAALVVTAVAFAVVAYFAGSAAYDWMKALHVIAIISWMAGMLYLPRLFIYHCDAENGSVQSETFKVMERRLLRAIINPAMIISWVVGLWLAWQGGWFKAGWFHGKLFAEDRNTKPASHWRLVNEIPTVLMIIIVVLVIVKPF